MARMLVLGVRGAVGRVVRDRLWDAGHAVQGTGRAAGEGVVPLDLGAADGLDRLAELAADADVVVNASGVEDPRLAGALAGTPLVDVSATGAYLDRLAAASAEVGGTVVLGAGIAPGLSTVLVRGLRPGPGDVMDVGVLLGTGEAHGAAAVEWTERLVGRDVHDPPEDHPVTNLRDATRLLDPDGVRRTYLRADFPDHVLLGRAGGYAVRSHLAMTSPAATAALRLVAHLPALRRTLRWSPHVGSSAWRVTARLARTGEVLSVGGEGQSWATGVLAARTAELALGRAGVMTSTDLLTVEDAAAALDLPVDRAGPAPMIGA